MIDWCCCSIDAVCSIGVCDAVMLTMLAIRVEVEGGRRYGYVFTGSISRGGGSINHVAIVSVYIHHRSGLYIYTINIRSRVETRFNSVTPGAGTFDTR